MPVRRRPGRLPRARPRGRRGVTRRGQAVKQPRGDPPGSRSGDPPKPGPGALSDGWRGVRRGRRRPGGTVVPVTAFRRDGLPQQRGTGGGHQARGQSPAGRRVRVQVRWTGPGSGLRGERAVAGGDDHVGHLPGDPAPDQPRPLRAGHPVGQGTGRRHAFRPMAGRRQRGQVGSRGGAVPHHHRLAHREHHREDHTERAHDPARPDRRRPPVVAAPHGPAPAVSSASATASCRTSNGRAPAPGG